MKLMRKLEKQALARAAKEARRQQGELELYKMFLVSSTLSKSFSSELPAIMAAEERRKHKEQMKILKQQVSNQPMQCFLMSFVSHRCF